MAKIRISVPLYRRTLFEDGWKQQPMPADVLPPPNNEWKWVTELPPLARISNPRLSFVGWQQSPLPADNELAVARTHDLVPRGLNRHTDTSYYQRPPIDSNDLSSALLHFTLPELGLRPLRFSYEGWTETPLAGDNELSSFRALFEVPLRRDLNSYSGFTVSPLPADVVIETPAIAPTFDWTAGRDEHAYVGFQVAPLADDNDPTSDREQTELPEPNIKVLHFDYGGHIISPLPDDNELSATTRWDDVPWGRNLYSYQGVQVAPTSEDFVQPQAAAFYTFDVPLSRDRKPVADFRATPLPPDNEASTSKVEFEVPQFRDLNQYTGWQLAPTVADNDIASVRVVTEVPTGRNLLPNFGFSSPPLSGPFQEVSSWVFDLDVRARDFDPQGWQHDSVRRGDVQTPVAGTREYGVPLGRLPSRDFTFALAGAAPELLVQATMPTPFYTMPHFGPLPLDAYVGATSTPLSADAPVATDIAIWRPTMRPRRRS